MEQYYFQWRDSVYGAFYRDSIIVLRLRINDYAALDPESSKYLMLILNNSFIKHNNIYICQASENEASKIKCQLSTIDQYIKTFLEQELISIANTPVRRKHLSNAVLPIGMKEMEWFARNNKEIKLDTKLVITAIYYLHKIHSVIKKKKIIGLVQLLENAAHNVTGRSISLEQSNIMAKALDFACFLYPRKTLCLPFAATLTMLHYKQNYECDFVVGIQTMPFYAHAWVEAGGKIINDTPELQTKLAAILRVNPKHGVV